MRLSRQNYDDSIRLFYGWSDNIGVAIYTQIRLAGSSEVALATERLCITKYSCSVLAIFLKMAQNGANSDFFCKNNLCLYKAKERCKLRDEKSDYISKYIKISSAPLFSMIQSHQ